MAATCCGFFSSPARPMGEEPTDAGADRRRLRSRVRKESLLCPCALDHHLMGTLGSSRGDRTDIPGAHADGMAFPAVSTANAVVRAGLISRALEVAGRLANDAAEGITAP